MQDARRYYGITPFEIKVSTHIFILTIDLVFIINTKHKLHKLKTIQNTNISIYPLLNAQTK